MHIHTYTHKHARASPVPHNLAARALEQSALHAAARTAHAAAAAAAAPAAAAAAPAAPAAAGGDAVIEASKREERESVGQPPSCVIQS